MILKIMGLLLSCALVWLGGVGVGYEYGKERGIEIGDHQAQQRQDWVIGKMDQIGVLRWCEIVRERRDGEVVPRDE